MSPFPAGAELPGRTVSVAGGHCTQRARPPRHNHTATAQRECGDPSGSAGQLRVLLVQKIGRPCSLVDGIMLLAHHRPARRPLTLHASSAKHATYRAATGRTARRVTGDKRAVTRRSSGGDPVEALAPALRMEEPSTVQHVLGIVVTRRVEINVSPVAKGGQSIPRPAVVGSKRGPP